jgi:uracil-DNA glycosylase
MNYSSKLVAILDWYKDRGLFGPKPNTSMPITEQPLSNTTTKILFIDNDLSDISFAKAGTLKNELDILFKKMCSAMQLKENEYILISTTQFSEAAVKQLSPKTLVLLGEATLSFFKENFSLNVSFFGNWFLVNFGEKFEAIATHHPLDLIKNPALKKNTWEHLKSVMKKIGNTQE